jgi:hypothetical protein
MLLDRVGHWNYGMRKLSGGLPNQKMISESWKTLQRKDWWLLQFLLMGPDKRCGCVSFVLAMCDALVDI